MVVEEARDSGRTSAVNGQGCRGEKLGDAHRTGARDAGRGAAHRASFRPAEGRERAGDEPLTRCCGSTAEKSAAARTATLAREALSARAPRLGGKRRLSSSQEESRLLEKVDSNCISWLSNAHSHERRAQTLCRERHGRQIVSPTRGDMRRQREGGRESTGSSARQARTWRASRRGERDEGCGSCCGGR